MTGAMGDNRKTPSFHIHSSQTASGSNNSSWWHDPSRTNDLSRQLKGIDFSQLFKTIDPRPKTASVGTDNVPKTTIVRSDNPFEVLQEEELSDGKDPNEYVSDNDPHKRRKIFRPRNNPAPRDSNRNDTNPVGSNPKKVKDKYTLQTNFKTRDVGTQCVEVEKIIIPRMYKNVKDNIDEQDSPIVRNTREVNFKLAEILPLLGRFVGDDSQLTELVHLLVDIIRIVSHREMNNNFIRDGIIKK